MAEGRLEPVHSGSVLCSTAVVPWPSPVRQAEEADFLDRLVAGLPVRSGMEDGAFTGWGEEPGLVVFGCGVAHATVVSAVSDDGRSALRLGNIEDVPEYLTVVQLAGGDDPGHDQQGRRVNPEMNLAIGATPVAVHSSKPAVAAGVRARLYCDQL